MACMREARANVTATLSLGGRIECRWSGIQSEMKRAASRWNRDAALFRYRSVAMVERRLTG
jgi:hypothetical protein